MPRVTKLEPQKKHLSRWSIFIDNRFFAGCSEEMMAELHLRVGEVLSLEQLDKIRDRLGLSRVRDSALRYLARRARSESEMRTYLKRKNFDPSQVDETIDWLKAKNFVNDEQFAESWVRNRRQIAPRGKKRLLIELQQKGINREKASQVVNESTSSEDEADAAYQAILTRKNRYRGMELLEIRKKIYNFLSYRGFSLEAVESAWERFKRELDTPA